MPIENPYPPSPQLLVKGEFCYTISCFTRRGGPKDSFDVYYIDPHVSVVTRVVEGKTCVVVGAAREIPIEEIFLTEKDALENCPQDKCW